MSFVSTYRKAKLWIHTGGLSLLLAGCVEPYDLPVQQADVHFLVVDGSLNATNGEVTVRLLRAALITGTQLHFEPDATVVLEGSEGISYSLNELDSGKYQATTPILESGKQYRIYIKTVDGKEYRSEFTTLKSTPEIKEIGWRAEADGTQIVVDTEDPNNETHYYRWTFEETWEYHSRYVSRWRFTGAEVDTIMLSGVAPRTPLEMIDVCYRTMPSTQILTTTTTGLTEDIVNDFELRFLPIGTEKLGYRYSILVRQYAIPKETYEYLEKLKKTSQDLDGLYAPQPSKVTGNVVNIADPSEVVLGYFGVVQATEKRLTITPEDLPAYLRVQDETSLLCIVDTIPAGQVTVLYPDFTLLEYIPDEFQIPIAFTYTSHECADCRVKGGVTTKPDFWP